MHPSKYRGKGVISLYCNTIHPHYCIVWNIEDSCDYLFGDVEVDAILTNSWLLCRIVQNCQQCHLKMAYTDYTRCLFCITVPVDWSDVVLGHLSESNYLPLTNPGQHIVNQ
jgi:hypothetical protein